MAKLRITYNAPVVLTFTLAALVVFVLSHVSDSLRLWFVAWPTLQDARGYVGMVSHILGHKDWPHLISNFTMILLLGPILEERHGSRSLAVMIVLTALITGLANLAFSGGMLLGASGVVFMMILLASMANVRGGEIPLTFIAVAIIFLGGEIVRSFRNDEISQMAHLVGGCAGAGFGFVVASAKRRGASKPKRETAVDLQRLVGAPKPKP